MEQLKVKKKDRIILNVAIYLCFSFFFLYIQHAYRHHLSPFSLVYLKKNIEMFWYVAITLLISGIFIWRHHKYSVLFYQLSIFLVSFKVLEGLFIEFNKIIVIAMFFYLTISYFLYQLLNHYFQLASINPNYRKDDLFKPLLKDIPCRVILPDYEVDGTLSNWDFEGCFVKLNKPQVIPRDVKVVINFRGREFEQKGEVVAAALDLAGIGIKFNKTKKDLNVFNWAEFMEIIQELGYQPERLR